MEPKPLFGNTNTTKAPESKTGAFLKSPLTAVPKKFEAPKAISTKSPPSALFPHKAISENIIDPIYAASPLCAGLTAKDIGRVKAIVESAKIEGTTYVLEYADDLRTKFASLVNDVVNHNTGTIMVEVNANISAIIEILRISKTYMNVLMTSEQKVPWYSFKKEVVPTLSEVVNVFEFQLGRVDDLVESLQNSIQGIVREVTIMDDMYKANREQFLLLNLHIIAGKFIIEKYNNNIIPTHTIEAKDDLFKLQDVAYLTDCIQRFDRKIGELEKLSQSVLLTGPQIRLRQANSKDLAEQIKQLTLSVVPVWKHQFRTILSVITSPHYHSVADVVTYFNNSTSLSILQDAQATTDKFEGMLIKTPVV